MADIDEFKEIFEVKKTLQDDKTEYLGDIPQQRIKATQIIDLSLNYKMIDLSLIESPANPGIGIQFISGLVNHSQGNITKYDYKTESFIISLKVNTLQKSPNCNYPIIIAKKIKFINSPEEFNGKNSDFYSKMDLKFEGNYRNLSCRYLNNAL